MKYKFTHRYLSIIFILATLLGVFHHHDDLNVHNDCQICTIQSTIADADTPSQTSYFTKLDILHDNTVVKFINLHSKTVTNPLHARAPPKIV